MRHKYMGQTFQSWIFNPKSLTQPTKTVGAVRYDNKRQTHYELIFYRFENTEGEIWLTK